MLLRSERIRIRNGDPEWSADVWLMHVALHAIILYLQYCNIIVQPVISVLSQDLFFRASRANQVVVRARPGNPADSDRHLKLESI